MDNASEVRPEGKEIRQSIFAPGNIRSGENSCRHRADPDERRNVAVFTIREEVVGDACAAGCRHDQRHVEQEQHAGNCSLREQSPTAQQPARLRPARQRVVLNGSHRPTREPKESRTTQQRNACRAAPIWNIDVVQCAKWREACQPRLSARVAIAAGRMCRVKINLAAKNGRGEEICRARSRSKSTLRSRKPPRIPWATFPNRFRRRSLPATPTFMAGGSS